MVLSCHCSCGHDRQSSYILADSSMVPRITWPRELWILGPFYGVVRLIATGFSTLLSVSFAIGGALPGAIAGALAGWASNRGIIRGAFLVAIAGASITLELLDALRTSWCPNCSSSCSLLSMTELFQRRLHQILAHEQLEPLLLPISRSNLSQQVNNRRDMHQRETNDAHKKVRPTGLSADSLKKLPYYILSDTIKAAEEPCCIICLQDLAEGDIARSLPQCHHTFHLTCVDRWLIRHGSCPVCRQEV